MRCQNLSPGAEKPPSPAGCNSRESAPRSPGLESARASDAANAQRRTSSCGGVGLLHPGTSHAQYETPQVVGERSPLQAKDLARKQLPTMRAFSLPRWSLLPGRLFRYLLSIGTGRSGGQVSRRWKNAIDEQMSRMSLAHRLVDGNGTPLAASFLVLNTQRGAVVVVPPENEPC